MLVSLVHLGLIKWSEEDGFMVSDNGAQHRIPRGLSLRIMGKRDAGAIFGNGVDRKKFVRSPKYIEFQGLLLFVVTHSIGSLKLQSDVSYFSKVQNIRRSLFGTCHSESGRFAAGASSLPFVHTLDYDRTQLANDAKAAKRKKERGHQFGELIDVGRMALKYDGFDGLDRGFNISCVGIVVYHGLYFGINDFLQPQQLRYLKRPNHEVLVVCEVASVWRVAYCSGVEELQNILDGAWAGNNVGIWLRGDGHIPQFYMRTKVVIGKLSSIVNVESKIVMSGYGVSNFYIFANPRPPEAADLEDKVNLKGGGVVTTQTRKESMEVHGREARPARLRSAPRRFEIEGSKLMEAEEIGVTDI